MEPVSSILQNHQTSPQKRECHRCDNGILDGEVYCTISGLNRRQFCECLFGQKAKAQWLKSDLAQRAIKQQKQREINAALAISNIPKIWSGKSVECLASTKLRQIVLDHLRQSSENTANHQGLYLCSKDSDVGKTQALSILCQEIIKRFQRPCVFLTEEELFEQIKASFDAEEKILHKIKNIDCLFIDDLGAARITPWKISQLTNLLDYRLSNMLPTFFSSNYNLADYINHLAQVTDRPNRIPARIARGAKIIEL